MTIVTGRKRFGVPRLTVSKVLGGHVFIRCAERYATFVQHLSSSSPVSVCRRPLPSRRLGLLALTKLLPQVIPDRLDARPERLIHSVHIVNARSNGGK